MRIFNIMLSRDLGGIQQAYCDYSNALKMQAHEVINIASIGALINKSNNPTILLPNLGSWCLLSKIRLFLAIIYYKPDAVICHGNRAVNFATFSKKFIKLPIVGVAHNYSVKYLKKCDYILSITENIINHLIADKFTADKIFKIPNMIDINHNYCPSNFQTPLVIGSIGRFVAKKGYIHLIEAIGILKNNGRKIKLILGGEGEEKNLLKQKIQKLNLENEISLAGWIHDKQKFFKEIDIFCLPSLVEPFGIIILEAMMHSKPVIATKSGGPEEIIKNGIDGLLCDAADPQALAASIGQLAEAPAEYSNNMTGAAYRKLEKTYSINQISGLLSKILKYIV